MIKLNFHISLAGQNYFPEQFKWSNPLIIMHKTPKHSEGYSYFYPASPETPLLTFLQKLKENSLYQKGLIIRQLLQNIGLVSSDIDQLSTQEIQIIKNTIKGKSANELLKDINLPFFYGKSHEKVYNFLKKHKKINYFKLLGIEEKTLFLTIAYSEQCNFEFQKAELFLIHQLGLSLAFSCYEDSEIQVKTDEFMPYLD